MSYLTSHGALVDEYLPAKPILGASVVNIGDMLERMTNGNCSFPILDDS